MAKRSKVRTERTADLRKAAEHVSYEIRMLVYAPSITGARHASPPTTPAEDYWNMAMESFLVHFRNLRAFLCPFLQIITDDDVIATDFLGERQPRDIGDSGRLGVDKERIDKMVVHLSYSREDFIKSGKSDWYIADLTVTMLEEFEKFLAQLPAEKVAWFPSRETIREYRRSVPGC